MLNPIESDNKEQAKGKSIYRMASLLKEGSKMTRTNLKASHSKTELQEPPLCFAAVGKT